MRHRSHVIFRITDTELTRRVRSRGFGNGSSARRQVTRAAFWAMAEMRRRDPRPNLPDALSSSARCYAA